MTKLWYEGSLDRFHQALAAAEPDEKRLLEQEFLALVTPNLDSAQRAVVEVAVLEQNPPPVLPLCLLASILEGWGTLTPATLHKFVDNSELGDLFVDVLRNGTNLSGLSTWGHRIAFYADDRCAESLTYLDQIFKQHPQALTEALSTIIAGVSGSGAERLLSQLVRLMEADGALLAQGLAITLHELLGMTNGIITGLPLEPATVDLTNLLILPDTLWQRLLEVLQRHQARSRYEDYVALLEALIILQRLTERANSVPTLTGLDWKQWLTLVDQVYLPLSTQIPEALRLTNRLAIPINLGPITGRAENARKAIADAYVTFYLDPNLGVAIYVTRGA